MFIDILSHYLYTVPLKSLTSKEMVDALKRVLERNKPTLLRSDRGREFLGAADKYLKDRDVKHVTTSEHSKAHYAERVIRTLKAKIGRYMFYNKMHRWLDALKDITESYNNTYHRTIKMSPEEALTTSDAVLWKTQYDRPQKSTNRNKNKLKSSTDKRQQGKNIIKFKVGDVSK